jgi:hypothetical protein
MTPEQGYPGMFHVGFLQPAQQAVDLMHSALSGHDYSAPEPAKLQRGGPVAYGFQGNQAVAGRDATYVSEIVANRWRLTNVADMI